MSDINNLPEAGFKTWLQVFSNMEQTPAVCFQLNCRNSVSDLEQRNLGKNTICTNVRFYTVFTSVESKTQYVRYLLLITPDTQNKGLSVVSGNTNWFTSDVLTFVLLLHCLALLASVIEME